MLNLYVLSCITCFYYPSDMLAPLDSWLVVTQIFRYLRPYYSWSSYCPQNIQESNAPSTGFHIFSNIRSVGKWLGVDAGDGRSGYADLGTIDKIEGSNREMHDFGHTFEVGILTINHWEIFWRCLLSLRFLFFDYSTEVLRFLATQNAAFHQHYPDLE